MVRALLLLLLLAGCSRGAEQDLQYVKQARSAAAEWALVNEQAAGGKLTETYAAQMRVAAREEIESAAAGVTVPDAPYVGEIKALLAEPGDAPPAALRAHIDRLKTFETSLESA
jgi:hypothetical protein